MKRKDILRKLGQLGFEVKEGGSHSKIYKDGVKVSVLSRQSETHENIVFRMEKQLGVKLR